MLLSEVVDIHSGRTFSHGVKESSDPTHHVIQLRDFSNLLDITKALPSLVAVHIESKRKINTLKDSDILIVAKGPTKKAICITNAPANIIPTQHFLFLRLKEEAAISPEFLTYFLNSASTQQWLNNNAGGSYQSTLTKTALSKLQVPVIDNEKEKQIIDAVDSIGEEIVLYEQLIESRRTQLDLIAQGLIAK
jgi:restriction endonuclease S subunit